MTPALSVSEMEELRALLDQVCAYRAAIKRNQVIRIRSLVDRLLASSRSPEGGEVEPKPLPLDLAPRDGTMLRLLVDYSEEANREAADALSMQGFLWPWTPLEDAFQAWTVGFNNLDNTGEDEWQFAGWNWSQDCFTEGHGKIIGWLPFHGEALATRSPVPPSEEDVARVLRPFIEAAANSAIPEPWEVVSGITSQATRAILALLPPGGGEGWRPPEGWILVPIRPPEELLMSMAIRQDHGLGVPGYYDQDFFGAEKVSHHARVQIALDDMRKVYEEVVGEGFYKPDNAERYRAVIAPPPPADVGGEGRTALSGGQKHG